MFGRKGREKNELVLFILMKPTNRNKSNKKGKKTLSSAVKFLRRNFFFITLYHVGNLILCLGSQLGHQSIGAGCFLKVPGRI